MSINRELLAKDRLAICEKCPIFKIHPTYGPVCDSNKYISRDGTRWSWFKKEGYVRGCGCHLRSKTRQPMNNCIINLW